MLRVVMGSTVVLCMVTLATAGQYTTGPSMARIEVYDKARFYDAEVARLGLPPQHAATHTLMFLRWLIERDLVSARFKTEGAEALQRYEAGKASLHDLYEWWDRCLLAEMLSEDGNAFASVYFSPESPAYLTDYESTLRGGLPSVFHIPYTEANYQKLKPIIDRRYAE